MGRIPKDSTLGDDEKGFQALANKKAQQNGTLPVPKAPPTTTSMQDALKGLAQQPQKFADGGEVADPMSDPLINGGFQMPGGATAPGAVQPASTPQAQPNGIQAASAALANTPDTPPSVYQGLSADDRLALQQKIMAANNSGPNLIAQGVGGIGDAISNSFGGKDTHFQKDIMANNQQQMQNKLGAVDTARGQRLEDVTGNQEAQMNDPASHISQSMRQTFKAAGINVASGMTGAQMMKIAPAIGDLAMKQATLGVQMKVANNNQANQQAERSLQATKDKADMGIIGTMKDKVLNGGQMSKALDTEIAGGQGTPAPAHGIPDLGSTFNGQKVLSVKKVS